MTQSWIIIERETGRTVLETWNPDTAKEAETSPKFAAIPAGKYLGEFNAKCTNANRGTFNHECGKPAQWIGTHANGHRQRFCDKCREHGDEARGVTDWTRYTPERWRALAAEDKRQARLAVSCDY